PNACFQTLFLHNPRQVLKQFVAVSCFLQECQTKLHKVPLRCCSSSRKPRTMFMASIKTNNMSYQPIENYGIIGDLNTVALVGLNGSVDFMCFPNFDSPSIFAALL